MTNREFSKMLNDADLAFIQYHERLSELNELMQRWGELNWVEREQILDKNFDPHCASDWADKIMSRDGLYETAYDFIPVELLSEVMRMVE